MRVKEILGTTAHRPWDFPKGKWKYYQEWNKAVFLHWKVSLNALEKIVPKDLEIDFFENQAWVSMVAFRMEKIKLRNLPPFPPISNFDEINIRTYVKHKGKAGVYFLNIEGGKKLSCKVAKRISELPYRYSNIKRFGENCYSSNKKHSDNLELTFKVGKEIAGTSNLDKWLMERYALFQDTKNHINEYEIHHLQWPVHELDLKEIKLDYPRFADIINSSPEKMHFSPGVKVMAWGKRKMERDKLWENRIG